MKHKAVFFDRDGVLNVDHGYVYKKEDWQWTPGAIDVIKWCNDNAYLVIVVTNQSGVARGYYTEAEVVDLHEWVNSELKKFGARIDAFYYCPHLSDGTIRQYATDCDCRKPKPGMLIRAMQDFNIDRDGSVLFGDKPGDIEAANNAGVRGLLIEKNRGWETLNNFLANL